MLSICYIEIKAGAYCVIFNFAGAKICSIFKCGQANVGEKSCGHCRPVCVLCMAYSTSTRGYSWLAANLSKNHVASNGPEKIASLNLLAERGKNGGHTLHCTSIAVPDITRICALCAVKITFLLHFVLWLLRVTVLFLLWLLWCVCAWINELQF